MKHSFFWTAFLLIVIVESISLIAYQGAPALQPIFLSLILLGTLFLAFKNIEFALLVAFGELFVGSFGHLFKIEVGPLTISLRIGLFLLINTFYFFYTLRTKSFPFRRSRFFWPNVAMFGLIVFGVVMALVNGHSLTDIFHDADAYIAFAYFPIAFAVFREQTSRDRLLEVFKASLLWLGIQTAIVLFVFAHRLPDAMQVLYLWIRDARIGEVTHIAGDFYRIFFQSYIFALVGVFLFGVKLVRPEPVEGPPKSQGSPRLRSGITRIFGVSAFWYFILSVFLVSESFSRSFWFGGLVAALVMVISLAVLKIPWREIGKGIARMFGGAMVALALIFVIVNFPLPPKGPPILLADLFGGRALALFGEAAASSRWQLLPAMWAEIKKAPLTGWGFGKTITYKTDDPRYLAEDPTGMRTTFAFEWGYLDLWLKLGLPGLAVYGLFIIRLLRHGWQKIKQNLQLKSYNLQLTEHGLWLGFIALIAAHLFTPYLNHPLGIGLLILTAAWFDSHTHPRAIPSFSL